MAENTATKRPPSGVPVLDIDLYSRDILSDPWPLLKEIRDAGPIVWNARGFWMTARDKICRQILNQPGPLGQQGMVSAFFGTDAFIAIDDKPVHNALRNVWVSAFSRDSVAALAPLVREIANRMLDALEPDLRAGRQVDLMAGLIRALPAHIIAHMIGVADDMIPIVIRWSDAMSDATAGGFPIDYAGDPYWLAAEEAKRELAAYLLEQIAFRRAHPGTDLVSRIVHSEIGATLGDQAMMVNLRQLLFAGNETTAKWLGNIFVTLGRYPDVRHALADDRSLLPAALEEIMRWQGVTQLLPRGVTVDGITIEGVPFARGDEITLLLGAANRDPERHDNPDVLDIRRPPRPHLGFGFGMHTCLGTALARMEAFELTSVILDRIRDYDVCEPVTYGNFTLRGPNEVNIIMAQKH